MFRLEAKFLIILSIIVAWLLPIYIVFKYAIDNKALQAVNANFERQLVNLEQRIEQLNRARETNSLRERQQLAHSHEAHREQLEFQNQSSRVNIFIELQSLAGDHELASSKKQFFKSSDQNSLNQQRQSLFGFVKRLPEDRRRRILVTGGAGFVGSHLVDSLMLEGHEVIVCDNFFTGRKSNIDHWQGHPNFELLNHDVINPLTIEVNEIYHLASPASPVHYMSNPIKTIKTNTVGTINMLGLAKRVGAKILIASTSEIYGDPEVHPQSETYWGHTNPIGPRSCYDESKRISESLAVAYQARENVSIAIARIFNTYGPRMHPNDGRVVSNFIIQALNGQALTVYGDGKQTRSFQYVSDLVVGLKQLMAVGTAKPELGPVNLGNPNEMTIYALAIELKRLVRGSKSEIVFDRLPVDDPHRRRPDIQKANKYLNWQPRVDLLEGLTRTKEYFEQELGLVI